MIILKYTKSFETEAITLNPKFIGINESGWEISGEVIEDYVEWVNKFRAVHKKYGLIEGDFETGVKFPSYNAMMHFMKEHKPDLWDYYDI